MRAVHCHRHLWLSVISCLVYGGLCYEYVKKAWRLGLPFVNTALSIATLYSCTSATKHFGLLSSTGERAALVRATADRAARPVPRRRFTHHRQTLKEEEPHRADEILERRCQHALSPRILNLPHGSVLQTSSTAKRSAAYGLMAQPATPPARSRREPCMMCPTSSVMVAACVTF